MDNFVIKNIQINGLQKIPRDTVLEYLPVKPGQTLTSSDTTHIIQTLYQTGFFTNVTLARQGDTLIINVSERPTIGLIKISGNKLLPTEDLMNALKSAGLSEGQAYNEATLDGMKQALLHQYNLLGRYDATVNIKVTSESRNRVGIDIQISEGTTARIEEINIIGNKSFSQKELEQDFPMRKLPWWSVSFFDKRDEYTAEKFQEDLNVLRNFYLDRGYLKFSVDSSQVTITPDRKHVYATIRITEGDIYTVKGYKFQGDLLGHEAKVRKLVTIKPGEVFSRQKIQAINERIGRYYSDMGYAGATVKVEPVFEPNSTQVLLIFVVDPSDRIYVRNIEYTGNTKTADEVMRRETRQMEGGVYSTTQIEEGKRRLNNLGYLENIEVKPQPVPGKSDQVDLLYSVKETSSTTASAQVGYSDSYGLLYGANITQKNYQGSGKSVSLGFNNSQYSQVYSFSYFNPYYTPSGISRGYSLYYQQVTPGDINIATYILDSYGGMMNYRIPLSEYSAFTFGYGYEYVHINTSTPSVQISNFLDQHGDNFNNVKVNAGWSYNNFDRAVFPTRGFNHYIGGEAGLPVLPNNLEYYKFAYDGAYYQPLGKGFIMALSADLGYGNGYGAFDELPFFKNFYAGGMGTVRGYEANTLGPRDSNGNALGGSVLAAGSFNLIVPNPIDKVRTSVFVDGGNVYDNSLNFSDLRYSAGIEIDWISPVGPLKFSLAKGLNEQPGDRMQAFQFAVGTSI